MTQTPVLPPGFTLAAFETLGSTNDEAKRRAGEGAPEGTVVWAHAQSQGRGRQDRTWLSPEGNLYCSIVLRPAAAPGTVGTLGFVAALAAAETLEELSPGSRPGLKWPNDVLLDGRKAAGILLEAGANMGWLVLGCGINLAHHPEGTPFPATSLRAARGIEVSAAAALGSFCAKFDLWYRRWGRDGFAPVRGAWLARAHPPGSALTVRTPTANLTGRFGGLDEHGVLLLEADDGRLHRIAAGDVYFASATT